MNASDIELVEVPMRISRPDRVVRALMALASFAYFFMWAGTAVVLIGLPVAKAFAGTGGGFYYSLELPVTAPALQTMVQTMWGPAPLVVDELRGQLKLPLSTVPWSFLSLVSVALVVVALAEVFRRGAELEHEQSLVV